LTPPEVVDAFIQRIEAVNPQLNAVVVPMFDAARRRAEQLACEAPGARPLYGVPFTIKEMIAVEGQPITLGSVYRRTLRATFTATVVERLLAAGAIPLGLTNLPEMGFWLESDNLLYGRTNNPFDLARHPGGSSGGEAAIIAASGSPFGLGSDLGGSIRMPAFFCGIYGHKPTPGVVPLRGHYPFDGTTTPSGSSGQYVAIGPLTHHAEDLYPVFTLIADRPNDLPEKPATDMRGRRVLICESPDIRFASEPVPAVRAGVQRAAERLAAAGAVVETWHHPAVRYATDIWYAALSERPGPSLAEVFTHGERSRISIVGELVRRLAGRSRHTLPAVAFLLGERLGTKRMARRALEHQRRLRADLEEALGADGLLVFPTHPRPAHRHGRPLMHPFDFGYTALFAALQLPATAVPMGTDDRGLPVGVQIIARHGRDDLTIGAAVHLSRAK
jgi:fatty acid amide hydrolase 2